MEPLILESCNSLWLFDTEQHRYCRVLRSGPRGSVPPVSQWEPYFELQIDESSERFAVVLNEAGTHRLQSWRHLGPCEACTQHATRELSLAEIHDALLAAPAPERLPQRSWPERDPRRARRPEARGRRSPRWNRRREP